MVLNLQFFLVLNVLIFVTTFVKKLSLLIHRDEIIMVFFFYLVENLR